MRRLLVVLLTLAVAFGALVANSQRAVAQGPQATFVDSVVFFEQPNAAVALQQVSRGINMQLYMFNLRTLADKQAALGDPNIWTVQTPGSVNDLWVNPLPQTGAYNPFQLQAVRRALNYLIDRDFIINEIYGGFGIPYISPWHAKMPEYRRESSFFGGLDSDFSYDPQRAATEITAALTAAGAAKGSDGKWRHPGATGALITVKFVIRIEDVRLDIGNYVAGLLEDVGFTVQRDYSPASEAFAKVYNGPPNINSWNVYTEGFAFTALVAWQDDWIAGFYTDFSGETIWELYDAPAALVAAADKLLNGQYADLADRQATVRTASRLAVEDGVRVWMVAENAVFIYNRQITGAVNDLMAGPWGLFTTRTARYATTGGELLVGQPVHWNSPWNTYRGFTWLYDATQLRSLNDPGVYFHPHTGLPIPIRAAFAVQTGGPTGTVPVPADASVYNAATQAWELVPAAATATSRITFDYTFGSWHHGVPASMDDIWYTIANFYRREGGTDKATNPYTGVQFPNGDIGALDPRADSPVVNQWLGLFKGARQVDADTLEIYIDYWHVDLATIAFLADIFPVNPWDVHELLVKQVLDNEARVDPAQAGIDTKPVIDLIRGATVTLMNADLPVLAAASHVPPGMSSFITGAEADARWAALNTFQNAYKHYFVSNGPFFLSGVNVAAEQSILSRFDPGYPFAADKWDSLLSVNVPGVSVGSIPEVVPGLPLDVGISTTVGGNPTSDVQINYAIRNVGLDVTFQAGVPTATGVGTWEVSLDSNTTARLVPGGHEFSVTVLGEQLGIPVTQTRAFIVIPALTYFERLIQEDRARIIGLEQDLGTANDQLASANAQIASLSNLLTVSIAVAIIAVVVSAVSVVMTARRGMRPPMKEPPMEKTGEEL